jgi:hypothetical protein
MKGDAGRRRVARENLLYFAFFFSVCQIGIILRHLIRGSALLLDFCLGSLPFPFCTLALHSAILVVSPCPGLCAISLFPLPPLVGFLCSLPYAFSLPLARSRLAPYF